MRIVTEDVKLSCPGGLMPCHYSPYNSLYLSDNYWFQFLNPQLIPKWSNLGVLEVVPDTSGSSAEQLQAPLQTLGDLRGFWALVWHFGWCPIAVSSVYKMFAAWLTGKAEKFSGLAGIAWKSTSGAKNQAFHFPCFFCAGIKKKLRKHYETCKQCVYPVLAWNFLQFSLSVLFVL